MHLISVTNNNEMSQKAATIISTLVTQKPNAVLGLATGGTPEKTYKALVMDHQQNGTSYSKIHTVNLDEYVGINPQDSNSYHSYMYHHFFKYIDIPANQTHLPDGEHASVDYCASYDQLIESLGGVDLQLLGIGRNGHIGFNEPGTPLTIGTHVVKLTPSTRQANARYFTDLSKVPDQAITMGIGTILKSRKIILIASGKDKAEAVRRLLDCSAPDDDFPASALVAHPDVTIIADEQALSLTKLNKE
ncbi:glucosamine-6-phosphate deaminase [Sporolactobacillus kofuensis]|uniref:Glucosamine-6-phosphate deaminase n=1 Tax=Sporolactobacillus kofuensis TaxID=269672 RepID=A0ABW1WFJ6_9BACL|nr:glucosamine-6-phosphate deaminase [Sporolactobacillus kofuensis]MCO7176266.1 glucosamine-6-phosphate deaminase [Sporolactobacillus kofuensis]